MKQFSYPPASLRFCLWSLHLYVWQLLFVVPLDFVMGGQSYVLQPSLRSKVWSWKGAV
jgi:hypothetical protein